MHILHFNGKKLPIDGTYKAPPAKAVPLADRTTLLQTIKTYLEEGKPVTAFYAGVLSMLPGVEVRQAKELTAQLYAGERLIGEVTIKEAFTLQELKRLLYEQCEELDEEGYEEALRLINTVDQVRYL